MVKWIVEPGNPPGGAVLCGIGVVLLLASLGAMTLALFGGPKGEGSWDRWTRRVLLAGGGSFLVFHLEAMRIGILWPPGGSARLSPWSDGWILEASWRGWASLSVALAATLLLHLARTARTDRALWTWVGVLLPLGVLAVVLREVALALATHPEPVIIDLQDPLSHPWWRDLLFPQTGWILLPASIPVVVALLARSPSVVSRFPRFPSPTAPSLQAGCLLTLSLVVLHVEKLAWRGVDWSDPDFALGVDPRKAGAVLLGAAALVLLALGWEGWERTLGMRGARSEDDGTGGGAVEERC